MSSDTPSMSSNLSKRNVPENQADWDLGFQFDEDLASVPYGKMNKFNEDPIGLLIIICLKTFLFILHTNKFLKSIFIFLVQIVMNLIMVTKMILMIMILINL